MKTGPQLISLILVTISMTACDYGNNNAPQNKSLEMPLNPPLPKTRPPGPAGISLEADQWNILYSRGMPLHPVADPIGWHFDFPGTPGSVHYVTTQVSGYATTEINATINIEASFATIFDFHTAPDNTCDAPPSVRLFFQRKGDDMTASENNTEYYRWWSVPAHYVLYDGAAILKGDLTRPQDWTSVLGKRGDASPAATALFKAAINDLANVGVTFGGGCFYGHGVFVRQGYAKFNMTAFTIK